MKISRPATAAGDAGDRRGDDTHWWKAYQLHSTAVPAMTSTSKLLSPGSLSRSFAAEHFRPTETEIHRAADKALRPLQTPPAHGEPPSD